MLFLLILLRLIVDHCSGEVVWAVNCGGREHVDSNDIHYQADMLELGTASDYGRSFTINRVPMEDQILYQTERYHIGDLSYSIPVVEDGNYVLTLKFSEVWFTERGQKVFGVMLHNSIPILSNVDIFAEVGFATALDKYIPIQITNHVLHAADQAIQLDNDFFTIDFIKSSFDNPKVNAIILSKGSIDDVPKLPPVHIEQPPQKPISEVTPAPDLESEDETLHKRPTRPPRATDPYASVDYSYLILPALATLGAMLPILFCLCKL